VSYSYDPAGNVTRVADTPPDGNAPTDVQCYRYDHLRRLTEAWTPADACAADPAVGSLAGAAPYWHSYTYDVTGNRLSEVQHGVTGDLKRTYAHPAPGQAQPHTLRSVTQEGPTGNRVDRFGYDAAGNTISRIVDGVEQTLDWDLEGNLSSVTQTAGGGTPSVTSFLYDADGNRLLRREPTATTVYLGSTEVRLERPSGVVRATRYYSDGDDTIAVRTYDNRLVWQIGDHQDTALMAVDASTLAVTRRKFTPFGAPRGASTPWKGERGFVDGTIDAAIGLTHLGAREYDPLIGRFLSVDPVIEPGNPQQLHGYLYSNNSPVTYSDPDGLCWPSWLCAAREKARQAREWMARKAAEARRWAAQRLAAARAWAARKAAEARRWAARKAAEARRWAARKAAEARRWAARKAAEAKRWAQRKARQAREWAQRKARNAKEWVQRKAKQAKEWVRRTVPNVVKRVWHVTRFVINIPSTQVGLGYAAISGASCSAASGLTFNCTGATRFAPKGGQTIGNAFITRGDTVSAEVHAHEARHSTQYTWFLGNPVSFGIAYGGASVGSAMIYMFKGPRHDGHGGVCDDRWACYNFFEVDADLDKGGYVG
jgi:RHS repeat-associated protein